MLIINEKRELIEDLDILPFPAYHLLPMDKYKPYAIFDLGLKFISIITSRGCPFQCTYCTSSQVFGKRWRTMSAKRIYELIDKLYTSYDIRHFYFQDDEFTINRKRVIKLCNLIIKNELPIVWECLARVSDVDDELLRLMYEAGCRGIVYGIEVGYEEGLKLIKKNITLEQAEKAIMLTKKNNIHARASFMMGFQWEGKEEIKQTIAFAKKILPDVVYFQVLVPYPHTEIYDVMKKENLIVSNDWDRYVQHSIIGTKPLIKTRHLTNKQLNYWNARAFISFYLSPRWLFNKLFSRRNRGIKPMRTLSTGFGLIRNSIRGYFNVQV